MLMNRTVSMALEACAAEGSKVRPVSRKGPSVATVWIVLEAIRRYGHQPRKTFALIRRCSRRTRAGGRQS